jgi:hypothetical protein
LINEKITKLLFDLPVFQFAGIFLRNNEYILLYWEVALVESKEFPDPPLDPVSLDRVARLFTDCDPQPGDAQPVFPQYDREMCGMMPLTATI